MIQTKRFLIGIAAMACKGDFISWSVSPLRVYKLEILSLQTRNSEFKNTKFRVFKLEIHE